MCLWNTKNPDNGQFQRWLRQEQIPWCQKKDLVIRMLMCNNKAQIFITLLLMCCFFLIGQMSRSKGLVLTKRFHHKEYSCEIWKLWHSPLKSYYQCCCWHPQKGLVTKCQSSITHCSKVISKVKVSELQNDRQDKAMCLPISEAQKSRNMKISD